MRSCKRLRTSGLNERMLRPMVANSGITFDAWPACTEPIVTTAVCVGSMLRETTVCKAMIKLPAIITGSTAWWGLAAWPPRPMTLMRQLSEADMKAPLPNMKVP